MNRAKLLAFTASVLWVIAAVMVALPKEMGNLQWFLASEKLLHDLHAPFIAALIGVDALIGSKLLQDGTKSAVKQNSLKIIIVAMIWILVLGMWYRSNPDSFWARIDYIGISMVFGLVLFRYWTYHSSIIVEPFTGGKSISSKD